MPTENTLMTTGWNASENSLAKLQKRGKIIINVLWWNELTTSKNYIHLTV